MNKDKLVTREIFCTGLHIREAQEGEAESRTITGRAILFNRESVHLWEDEDEYAVEVIAPEAVTRELLDQCDIKMTMFHNRQLILARSRNGEGTLSYDVDDEGVTFEFEAPRTVDGDKALELVRRGDLAGCSFAFRTHYYDAGFVTRTVQKEEDKTKIVYTVRAITDVRDFTLAADPAYPDTECDVRELREAYVAETTEEKVTPTEDEIREQEKKNAAILGEVRKLRKKAAAILR